MASDEPKVNRYHFDRFAPEYRRRFESITQEMQGKCPVAWTDTHTPGPRIGAGLDETFEAWQKIVDEKRLAEPITVRKTA
jgi:hypothetical protein